MQEDAEYAKSLAEEPVNKAMTRATMTMTRVIRQQQQIGNDQRPSTLAKYAGNDYTSTSHPRK